MSIEWIENYVRAKGDDPLADTFAGLRKVFEDRHNEQDIPLPKMPTSIYIGTEPLEVFSTSEVLASELVEVINKYKESWNKDSLTPELINTTWDTFWRATSEKAELDHELQVPSCDRSAEELAALRKNNRGVVLLPDEIMTDGGIPLIAGMLPEIASPLLTRRITNYSNLGGCVDVEMGIEPPYLNRSAKEMQNIFFNQGREGQRIQTYVIASKFRELLTGTHFDQSTLAILLGSETPGRKPLLVSNRYDRLDITAGRITSKSSIIGFRSEGRKKR